MDVLYIQWPVMQLLCTCVVLHLQHLLELLVLDVIWMLVHLGSLQRLLWVRGCVGVLGGGEAVVVYVDT